MATLISSFQPERWSIDKLKLWFEQNHISIRLMMLFEFQDGIELTTYAQTLISFQNRIDDEYDRLVSSLKRLVEKSQPISQPRAKTNSSHIL